MNERLLCRVSAASLLAALLLTTATLQSAPHGLRLIEPTEPAPEIGLMDITGRHHALADYRGQVLVINFWATWCTPCRTELPTMSRTAEELRPAGVRFITIAMGQTEAEIREFVRMQDFPMPKLFDPDASVSGRWRVQALPTTYVVDPSGRLALRVVGNFDWDSARIKQELSRLARPGLAAAE